MAIVSAQKGYSDEGDLLREVDLLLRLGEENERTLALEMISNQRVQLKDLEGKRRQRQ
uniref:Uncharacterized protein n=1 Tax=Cucumis melo TaxID=3656 RepID=A0A9I9CXP6_CUCME